ncbi:MAG: bifunctional oligoribonuclease/PAP phosphatase NrnA [Velocimicrobium sp.]
MMNDLFRLVESANSIGISGHIRPDGDCVGSCLGLYSYLKEYFADKRVDVYLDPFSETFSFLNGVEEVKTSKNVNQVYDLFISLDCGSSDRLGDAESLFKNAGKRIVIDHHISNTKFGMTNIIEPQKSSTCEILFSLLDETLITSEIAQALYLGIVYDTGVFKHSNTTMETMVVAGKLIKKGIPFSKIIDDTFYQKTYLQNQILGRCLLESFLLLNGTVIASCVDQRVLSFYGAKPDDLDGIVDQMRVTNGVEVAIFAYEMESGEYKVSMRSNGAVDVSKIAVYFGGGGHVKAAGCALKGSYHDVITNITGHIESQLRNC